MLTIDRFKLTSTGPLHIGTDDGELLIDEGIDEEAGHACFPGTSFVGPIRAFVQQSEKHSVVEALFGAEQSDRDKSASVLQVQDMISKDTVTIDYRPGVQIDGRLGSAGEGKKFERSFIEPGAAFFGQLSYCADTEEQLNNYTKIIRRCFQAINSEHIRFGAYKSSGGGTMRVDELRMKRYDLYQASQLFSFLTDPGDVPFDRWGKKVQVEEDSGLSGYTFSLRVRCSAPLLIRGDEELEKQLNVQAPEGLDAAPIQQGKGGYYIPGSSWKGVLRNQLEKILKCYHCDELIPYLFGRADKEHAAIGMLFVSDAPLSPDPDVKKLRKVYFGIHIDKFTGGVTDGALRQELTIRGKAELKLNLRQFKVDGKKTDQMAGAIVLALRDLAEGGFSLGSHASGGFGFFKGDSLNIVSPDGNASIQFAEQRIENKALIDHLVLSLREGGNDENR